MATGEGELFCEIMKFDFRGFHGLGYDLPPDLFALLHFGYGKVKNVTQASQEGLIQILLAIGGKNGESLESFHALQQIADLEVGVDPEFRRRVDLDGRRRRRFDPGPGVPHPSRALLLRAVSGWWQEAWEYNDRISSRAGVEMRHPFQDLRLIRLCLGLPPESLWDGVRTKAVLREALRGRVPEDLRLRAAKPHATALEVRLLGAMARRDGTGFRRLEARGWVDAPVLGAMARRLREGACEGSDRGMEEALVVGKALALESWLGSMGPDGPPPEGGWEGEEA